MSQPTNVTLGELKRLLSSIEDGGATGLEIPDLAFIGRQMEEVIETARGVLREVEVEVHKRLNEREAETLAANGSSIARKWTNAYKPDTQRLFDIIAGLDAEAAQDLFEFVGPKTTTVPAHWDVRNTTKLVNYIEKLGLSGERQSLLEALGRTKTNPKLTFKAVNPETGEIL